LRERKSHDHILGGGVLKAIGVFSRRVQLFLVVLGFTTLLGFIWGAAEYPYMEDTFDFLVGVVLFTVLLVGAYLSFRVFSLLCPRGANESEVYLLLLIFGAVICWALNYFFSFIAPNLLRYLTWERVLYPLGAGLFFWGLSVGYGKISELTIVYDILYRVSLFLGVLFIFFFITTLSYLKLLSHANGKRFRRVVVRAFYGCRDWVKVKVCWLSNILKMFKDKF
jgi:hypothetical protein